MQSVPVVFIDTDKPAERAWPTWTTPTKQGKDAVVTAITDFFWVSMAEAISSIMEDTITIAKRAGINVLSLSKQNSIGKTTLTEEEKAFVHISRCLLQTAGLFDIDVLLEYRGDRLGLPIEALDWLFSQDIFHFVTKNVLHWGNSHGSILWGPLKFETGIKTEDNQVAGVLVTARYNAAGTRAALRLVPLEKSPNPIRLDTSDLDHVPDGKVSRIPTFPAFALVKEVIDGLFVQVNNKDYYCEAVLDSFALRTLEYYNAKAVQRLRPAALYDLKVKGVNTVVQTWKSYQDTKAFEKLVTSRATAFADLIWKNTDITKWSALFQNCQQFCQSILESKCFLREDGYDRPGLNNSSLPSVLKVFPLVDDQAAKMTPVFNDYFKSVQLGKEGATMASFKEKELAETLETQPDRSSLLDLRILGIPVLPNTAEYSKTNQRLGIKPDEPNDAWFALSVAALYFVAPADLGGELVDKLVPTTRDNGLGMLALGVFQWLEIAANPRLLNSILFHVMTELTEQEREDIKNDTKYQTILTNATQKLTDAQKQLAAAKTESDKKKWTAEVKKWQDKVDAIKACRNFEVEVPKARAAQRGNWNWLEKLG